MRNYIVVLTSLALLSSCCLLSERNDKRVYNNFTPSEKATISQGNSIEKVDTIKRKQYLQFGPIKVSPKRKGIEVTEYGLWKHYISGRLFQTIDFDNGIYNMYTDGLIFSTSYDLSRLEALRPPVPGEIIEQRTVNFRNGNIFDTTFVFHYFTRLNKKGKRKPIRNKDFISNGWNGIKPTIGQRQ